MANSTSRFHFKSNIKYDIALLSEVESINPFQVPTIKSGPYWKQVARNLSESNLKLPVDYRKCRERVTQLIKEHNGKEALSIKASGVAEEQMTELVHLLTSVSAMNEVKPVNITASSKRTVAEETRDRALDVIQEGDGDFPLDEREAGHDVPVNGTEGQPIQTTEDKLSPEGQRMSFKKRRIEKTGVNSEVVAYLKDKAQKELDFKREELTIRAAESENKKLELQLMKEKQDAEILERKRINDFMFKMLEAKSKKE